MSSSGDYDPSPTRYILPKGHTMSSTSSVHSDLHLKVHNTPAAMTTPSAPVGDTKPHDAEDAHPEHRHPLAQLGDARKNFLLFIFAIATFVDVCNVSGAAGESHGRHCTDISRGRSNRRGHWTRCLSTRLGMFSHAHNTDDRLSHRTRFALPRFSSLLGD
jgi:hypothetical protein